MLEFVLAVALTMVLDPIKSPKLVQRDSTAIGTVCSACQALGLKSRVLLGGCWVTLIATHEYYDENGIHHYEDPNIATCEWSCTGGHGGSYVRRQGVLKSAGIGCYRLDDKPQFPVGHIAPTRAPGQ